MSRVLIGIAALWLFASGFTPASTSVCGTESPMQRDCKPCKRPDGSLNHSPNVTNLVLDKTQVRLPDPQLGAPADEPVRLPDLMVNVATNAEDAENDVLDYYYVVSGGRIVGSGSSVQWDLNGVAPGTYTITARVDDSCGVCGKTITQAVLVIGKMPIVAATPIPVPVAEPASPTSTAPPSKTTKAPSSVVITRSTPTTPTRAAAPAAAASSAPCSCPKIMISDPEKSDADLVFTTKIFDLTTANRLTYIWTVTGGSVVTQDGRSIRVKPGVLGGTVTVSVNGLDPKCSCPNRAEKSF
jgi:hypothetical protein